MAAEKLFRDWHLPNGMNLATNPSNSKEEQVALEDLFTGEDTRAKSQELYQKLIKGYAESLSALDAATTAADNGKFWFRTYSPINPLFLSSPLSGAAANIETHGQKNGTSTNVSSGDNQNNPVHTQHMKDITREELSSTLSAIEERMDKRVERMELDSARRSDDLRREMRLRERSARRESIATKEALQAHIESNDKAVTSTLAALERTEKEFGTVKQANKEQRYWMAGIGVAIVLGIMGANATIFGGGKTFFDGGANSVVNQQQVEKLIQEAKAQSEANSALLKQIQTRHESLVAPAPVKP